MKKQSQIKSRPCVFCGGHGKRSKEHVFGDWLKEHFPRDEHTLHTSAKVSWPENLITRKPIENRRVNQGHIGSKKLRIVCQTCNNGWLSKLEDDVKPVLIPLIKGEQTNLTVEDQDLLSRWAVKTAMVAEYFIPRDNGIPQSDRKTLMENDTVPNGWCVWIARYDGEAWANLSIYQSRGRISFKPVHKAKDAPYYVQATTFGMEKVLFSVISTTANNVFEYFSGREVEGFIQIAPFHARSILWPPTRVLDDSQANAIANILNLTNIFDHTFDPGKNWNFTL